MTEYRVLCGGVVGVKGVPFSIRVEPKSEGFLEIHGLPETQAREVRIRVRHALDTLVGHVPISAAVYVEDAPRGSRVDLAVAMGLFAAARGEPVRDFVCLGELSLGGEVRPVRGVLPIMLAYKNHRVIFPRGNELECDFVDIEQPFPVATLKEAIDVVWGSHLPLDAPRVSPPKRTDPNMSDIRGMEVAKRALEIAATGRHHLLLVGPPGSGKTMLARRLPRIMPPMTRQEQLEVASTMSASGLSPSLDSMVRPFRAPHHTESAAALVGGGDPIRPGEATLANHGVLFLDELPEFRTPATDAMWKAFREGVSVVSRLQQRVTLPARPLVVAAMNPCPCGWRGSKRRACSCSDERVANYWKRLAPLMPLFDLHVRISSPYYPRVGGAVPAGSARAKKMQELPAGDDSETIRDRVSMAANRHRIEFNRLVDSYVSGNLLECVPNAVSYVRVLRVAQTIHALDQGDPREAVREAFHFNSPDGH